MTSKLKRARRFVVLVVQRATDHGLSTSAAAVAFFTFLAFIPMLAALVLLYGLIFDPSDVADQIERLRRVAPREVIELLSAEAQRLTRSPSTALGLGAIGGLLLAIWSSSKGSRALIDSLDAIHNEKERHGILGLYVLSLIFTVSVLVGLVIAIGLLVTLPLLAPYLPEAAGTALLVLRWALLFFLITMAIGGFYRFAPKNPSPGFFTAGTLIAALLWLIASYLFQLYVERIVSASASFGSVSGVAVFLLWLYLSALVVLVGAEIDRVRVRDRGDPVVRRSGKL
jgi:membrane protein